MADYSIRFADVNDIPSIMKFIDENWKKNHILAKSRKMFEWQYVNNQKLNMVIGEDEANVLQAILGYIPYSNEIDKDFSLALWKAKNGTSFLGVKLLMFLLKEEPHSHVFCNGINVDTTGEIYRRLGFKIGKLKQWYRLCDFQEYKIAKVNKKIIPSVNNDSDIKLVWIKDFLELKERASQKMFNRNVVPYKSEMYIRKRYFEHPIYEYYIYGLVNITGEVDAAVVFRIQECNSSKALRIIDFLGDYSQIYRIMRGIDRIAREIGVEYIDIYEMGLNDSCLIAAGWLPVGEDENIIPNYFAPYVLCNIDINISTTDEKIILFKGDGDQDRPN